MKTNFNKLIAVTALVLGTAGFAQVGIGTDDPKATLDIFPNDAAYAAGDGVLIPRVTAVPGAGTGVDEGELVYVNGVGLHYYDGANWQPIGGGGVGDATDDAWIDNNASTRIELGTLSDGTTARTNATSQFYITDSGKMVFGDDLSESGFVNFRRTSGNANLKLSANDGSSIVWLEGYDDVNDNNSIINFATGRGTDSDDFSGQNVLQDGDGLGSLHFWGYNENGTRPGEQLAFSAAIRAEVDGAITTGTMEGIPSRITFTTSDATTSAAKGMQEKMVLDSQGFLGIGVFDPAQRLDVDGNVQFSGALMPSGAAGTAGQILQSNGDGNAPTWVDASSGGNGIYGASDTTSGDHTATLAGDLTFNGSAPGNDVIIGSNSALRTNGAVYRSGIASAAVTVDATGDDVYAVELTATSFTTQNLNLPDCDPTVNQYREMVLIFGPFMTPGTIKEENSTDGLDKTIAADRSYTIMCSPSKGQWTVTAGGI